MLALAAGRWVKTHLEEKRRKSWAGPGEGLGPPPRSGRRGEGRWAGPWRRRGEKAEQVQGKDSVLLLGVAAGERGGGQGPGGEAEGWSGESLPGSWVHPSRVRGWWLIPRLFSGVHFWDPKWVLTAGRGMLRQLEGRTRGLRGHRKLWGGGGGVWRQRTDRPATCRGNSHGFFRLTITENGSELAKVEEGWRRDDPRVWD